MSKGDAMAVPGLTHLFTMRAALGAGIMDLTNHPDSPQL
jgi:hypothetical protein